MIHTNGTTGIDIEKRAEKLNPKDDFFDVSAVFGKWFAIKIVKFIYYSPVTPIHVSILAFFFGILSVFFILQNNYTFFILSALFIQIKNILDTVDGHLARARDTPSRIGRFLDSVVDFTTNLLLFVVISAILYERYKTFYIFPLALFALLSSNLQCTYYVYYTITYLNKLKRTSNRADESFIDEDEIIYVDPFKKKILYILQTLFIMFYGWQDRLMLKIDKLSLTISKNKNDEWFMDKKLLFLNSFLGLGTQLFMLSFFLTLNSPFLYLWFVIIIGNLYWLFLIIHRILKYKEKR